MADDEEGDVFGYRNAPGVRPAVSLRVGEGKHSETLQPEIMIYFRIEHDEEPVVLALELTLAEFLRDELEHWCRRAHEKHFE
jgi:hypothetical protein